MEKSTHAVLGIDRREINGASFLETGVLLRHDNEFMAYRDAAERRSRGAKVFVAPIENGRIPTEYFQQYSELIREYYADEL